SRATSGSGTPIGTTLTRPASSTPGPSTRASFAAAKVGVSQARTTGPSGAAPSAGSPDGTSRATTGLPLALIASIRAATSGAGAPAGVLHERGTGDAEVGDGARIHAPHLLGGEHGPHSATSRQRHRLRDEVGQDGCVELAELHARRLGQLDVERALGQPQDPVALGARRRVKDRIGRLDEYLEPRRPGVAAQVGVADHLAQRAQPLRVLRIDAHGGDLDTIGRLAAIVAVDLGVEAQRTLGNLTYPARVALVDEPRALARRLLRRRPARRALERAIDLVAAAGPLARVGFEVEPGGHDEAE